MTTTVLETLVGEGKKFSDAEALAKGKLAADEHIANLNAQLEALKAQVASGASVSAEALDKILTEIKQSKQTVTNPSTSSDNGNQSVKAPTEAEIVAIVNRQHEMRAQAQVRAETLGKVEKVYGSKSGEFLTKVADETGFSLDQLKALAGTNPSAFLRIANLNTVPQSSGVSSSVNSEAVSSSVNLDGTVRNKSWYDAKRKEMGATKFAMDRQMQQQIHADRQRLGDSWDS